MDNLGWDNNPPGASIKTPSSSLWSNHQQHEMDLPQGFFGSIREPQTITDALMAQYIVNPNPISSGVIAGFGVADGLQLVNGFEDGKVDVVSNSSLESLDCLLSATNSINTDTSVEDDGISMILSDCRNLWNFSSSNVVSQGFSKLLDSTTTTTTGRPTSTNKRSKEGHGGHKVKVNYQYFDLLQSDSSTTEGGFQFISENPALSRLKKPRLENDHQRSSNINFQQPSSSCLLSSVDEPDTEAIAHMKEMMYRAAAFRPVNLEIEVVEKPKRKNVRISSDPQTVAARHRRERISEKIRVLQRLVPGGSKMDTATMLDEAANYLKFLRSQIKALENMGQKLDSVNSTSTNLPFPSPPFNYRHPFPMHTFFPVPKP
ncbi:transcription factor bHLH87-like [Telopea speciosissima]|uniref:transcription factor bHLH87-like n=1 Tax=Telopea speciosissima TaxID=54955 RepID=UPI001CC81EE7|nr:transcription factor bHLH87-like [Telopea speciosissima]